MKKRSNLNSRRERKGPMRYMEACWAPHFRWYGSRAGARETRTAPSLGPVELGILIRAGCSPGSLPGGPNRAGDGRLHLPFDGRTRPGLAER